jgi:FkbH-like protein
MANQEWGIARALLRELVRTAPDSAVTNFVSQQVLQIPQPAPLTRLRMAFLRSFTLEPVVPLLRAEALLYGIELITQMGGFNAYAPELLNHNSQLYHFDADVVVLAIQTRDLLPQLWEGFADLTTVEVEAAELAALRSLSEWISAFRQHSHAPLVIHNFEVPAEPAFGVLDAQSTDGQIQSLQRFNRRLAALAAEHPSAYVLDYDGLVASFGRHRWHDERKWLTARMPVSAHAIPLLAKEYMRFVLPLLGRVAKALVVDLDNTLWGGVVADDGIDCLRLDAEYPAVAHLRLQRAILDLHARGVILAVASKNNPADALEVLETHPKMLLRPSHFAALRINWNDKVQSLREIASELNIGLDSIAFLDDSPVERLRVSVELPQVAIIELPSDPMDYADTLRSCPVFERLAISSEDRDRGRHYWEQRRRHEAMEATSTVGDYYRSLGTRLDIRGPSAQSLPRVAQLTQKTNQFNLTTRRYTEAEIAAFMTEASVFVYEAHVSDRFGDSGLVGVAIIRDAGSVCEIDTLLLSCRVIERTIETAVLSRIADDASDRGLTGVRGWFIPTTKNLPAADFYPNHGFTLVNTENDKSVWELDLRKSRVEWPTWIARGRLA